ncbi:fimbrillin family protein [Alistipes dispar]|uniref:fimbrillin family protein n=1 Tax=Alistipes dispar TaxID=2585119 RepID=UPI003A8B78E8
MRKRSYDTLLAAAAATVMLLISACSEDPTADNALAGSELRFEVAGADGWQSPSPQSRAAEETTDAPEYAGVFTLQGETPADTLFLHATVADGIESGCPDAEEPQTRATPVDKDTFYDSFGVLASAYTESWREDSCRPDYMYDVEVTKASGWATDYFWPGGQQVRFFAYAPYGGPGIALSDKSAAGTPEITYSVPSAVADQQDLCVAVTGDLTGSGNSTVPLTFGHVLTAVRFTTGDKVLAGKITKITLKNVYGKAALSMGSDSWGGYGATADFSQTLAATVDGSAGQAITPDVATFMMLPQTLPDNAQIEVVYTDDLTSTRRTLTASIAGSQWPMGRLVTYRISTSSIVITPTFTVTAPADFTHAGGSKKYSVTSYAAVSRPGDPEKSVPVAWSAEFVEDDGSGGYNVIARPEWLTAFTASGDGGMSAKTFTATITAQQGVTSNAHNDALQAAPAVSGTYDLSTSGGTAPMNTANCYVINAPGQYSLPLVYGNAIKDGGTNASAYTSQASGEYVLKSFVNHLDAAITDPYIYNNAGCTPLDAVLVWQDEENLVTNVRLAEDGHRLIFDVPQATIKQGNAIVAVRDADSRIMWSWHIWVTDFVPGLAPTVEERYDPVKTPRDKVVTNYQGVKYTFMGVNIGWCDAETITYAARSVKVRFTQAETGATQVIEITQTPYSVSTGGNAPFYQWGRKDPMLPSTGSGATNKTWYNAEGTSSTTLTTANWTTNDATITNGILNPGAFCTNNYMDYKYYNLWSSDNTVTTANDNAVIKTIYDPSPVGYHLPPSNAFTGFTYNGNNISGSYYGSQYNSPYVSADDFTTNGGWIFYCNKMNGASSYDPAGGTIFYPASGYRYSSSGALSHVGSDGYYWSAVPCSTNDGRYLNFYSSYVRPLYNSNRSSGFAVRPVQE